jgi:hypothetical protein
MLGQSKTQLTNYAKMLVQSKTQLANYAKMLGQSHFAEPNRHVLSFFHPNIIIQGHVLST